MRTSIPFSFIAIAFFLFSLQFSSQAQVFDPSICYTIRNAAINSDSVLTCTNNTFGVPMFQKLTGDSSQLFKIYPVSSSSTNNRFQIKNVQTGNNYCLNYTYGRYATMNNCPVNGTYYWNFNKEANSAYSIRPQGFLMNNYLLASLEVSRAPIQLQNKCLWYFIPVTPLPLSSVVINCMNDQTDTTSPHIMAALENYNILSRIKKAGIRYRLKGSISYGWANFDETFTTATFTSQQTMPLLIPDNSTDGTYEVQAYYDFKDEPSIFSNVIEFGIPNPYLVNPSSCIWSYSNTPFWAFKNVDAHPKNNCNGFQQSPIAIYDTATILNTNLDSIALCGPGYYANLIDNGHTLQIATAPPVTNKFQVDDIRSETRGLFSLDRYVIYNRKKYNFLQIHFHTPSEHTINGLSPKMEIHMVHQSPIDSTYLVVTVLVNSSDAHDREPNKTLWEIAQNWPSTAGVDTQTNVLMFMNNLLPTNKAYYTYGTLGSLTTPPCLQGVTFLICKTPVVISYEAMTFFENKFHQHHAYNARGVQPLNGRAVYKSK